MVVGDVAVVAEREHAESLDRLGALGDDQVAGERVDVVEADVGTVGRARSAQVPRPGLAHRRDHQLEVLGAVGVREHEEAVAGRSGVVLDVVLEALCARLDDRRRRGRLVGVDEPHLAGHLRR